MTTILKRTFLLSVVIGIAGLITARQAAGQTFTVLHSFTTGEVFPSSNTNSDGKEPECGLVLSGNTLYGMASSGGSAAKGVIFSVNTDGTGFANLHNFTGYPSDGENPFAGFVLSGNTLYGTTWEGGKPGNGTVFSFSTNGDGVTILHNFADYPTDGADPLDTLILSGNTLYGTANGGGTLGGGSVFAVNTDGSGYAALHNFSAPSESVSGTNSDGALPYGGLVVSGNTLYGTAGVGGQYGSGTVFAVNTDGSGFATLHVFTATVGEDDGTNSDGSLPHAGLVLSGSTLFGTTQYGGRSGYGVIFKVNTDGSGFATLHNFAGYPSDGSFPQAGMILSGNTLYGTTAGGGAGGSGTVFSINTDGSGFKLLYSFTNGDDGALPEAGVILAGNTLYGTAYNGGAAGNGTVFSLTVGGGGGGGPPSNNGLTLVTNGYGTIQHGAWPRTLVTGKKYTVTAVPKAKNLFINWTGGTSGPYSALTNTAGYSFLMESNLVLEANFETNVFLAAQGTYRGLFAPANTNRQQTNSGSFVLTVTSARGISGSFDLGGHSVPFSAKFDPYGAATTTSKRPDGQASLTAVWQLDFDNQSISGTVTDEGFTADLSGFRDGFNNSLKATAYEGKYTFVIPGATNPAVGPFGTSCGTVNVSPTGAVTLTGNLADGTTFSQSSAISPDGHWPMYVSLYRGNGSLWGTNLFTNNLLTNASRLSWINEANSSRTAAYTSGFTNPAATLHGGIYLPGQPLPSGMVTLQDTNFTLVITNTPDNTNKLKLKTTTAGVVSGTFANPDNPSQTMKINGVVLQSRTNEQGYFLDGSQSGVFLLGNP